MLNNPQIYTSEKDYWETPQSLFNELDAIHHFDKDVAASHTNAKCKCYYTEKDNALTQDWNGCVWCNPPYGRDLGKWVEKAYNESQKGNKIVMLIPSRTGTIYWHKYIFPYSSKIDFLQGRLHFEIDGIKSKNASTFDSAIVIFDGTQE